MPISPRASPIGLPALRASSAASSSCCASSASASAVQQRARGRRARPPARPGTPPWRARRRRRPPRRRARGISGEHLLGGGLEDLERRRAHQPATAADGVVRGRRRPRVDSMVRIGPVNVLARAEPATRSPTIEEHAAGHERRVVERASSRSRSSHGTPAGLNGRLKMITHDERPRSTATGFIHLYFLPSVHGPGLERVAHPPAQVDRDHVGDVEADHADRDDREERDRDAVLVALERRDRDDQRERRRRRCTALNGIRCWLTVLQSREPGIAPSRENAYIMREALVRQPCRRTAGRRSR